MAESENIEMKSIQNESVAAVSSEDDDVECLWSMFECDPLSIDGNMHSD